MINDLHRSMKSQQEPAAAKKLSGGLVGYTDMHFSMEEDLFDKFGYKYDWIFEPVVFMG